MWLVFLVVLSVLAGLLWHLRARRLTAPGLHCPEEFLPWFGSFFEVTGNFDRHHDWKVDLLRRAVAQGKELGCWSMVASPPYIELASPRMVKYVLSDAFASFEKGPYFHSIFKSLLGEGIFNSDGEAWREQRKVASHMFSSRRLNEYMLDVFHAHAQLVLKHLAAVEPYGTIDMQDLFARYTLDSIGKVAFGIDLHSLASAKDGGGTPPFVKAFDAAQETTTKRWFVPKIVWRTKRFLRLGDEGRLRHHVRTINDFVYGVVRLRKENMAEFNESGDLLSLFLQDAAKRGVTLSDSFLRDLILNFLIVRCVPGSRPRHHREVCTPAAPAALNLCCDVLRAVHSSCVYLLLLSGLFSALTYMFKALSEYPDVERRVCDELHAELGPDDGGDHAGLLDEACAKRLPYLEAVFLEVTRLYAPVAGDLKVSVADCVFPDGTPVPAGTVVDWAPYALARLESIWGPDAEEFHPERWLDDAGHVKQPSAFQFPSFNAGPRLCLGKSMAILEAKVLASAILQRYALRIRPGADLSYRISVVLTLKHGLPMTVRPRNNEL